MVKFRRNCLAFHLLVTALLATPLLATPIVASSADVVNVEVGAVSVIFNPQLARAGYLTVSGPEGFRFEERFEAGGSVSFSPLKEDGGLLASGVYKWQLYYVSERGEEGENVRGLGKAAAETAYGTLRIRNGNPVNPNVQEQVAQKDILQLDDVIIEGSLCAGIDCDDGESFGFDVLRLKENNVRIHFEDTSASASFPSNDWRIVINDTANGGGNYFAVEDSSAGGQPFRVDAGAPGNSLRVDSSGDVGFGTNNPAVDAHIVSSNTPTLRLEQNFSGGFTAQTYDIGVNETNFFIRDISHSSKLFFRARPDAPTNSLYIDSDGDIGLGTDSPSADLHVRRLDGTDATLLVESANATGAANLTLKQVQDVAHNFRLENGGQAWVIQNNASGAAVNPGAMIFSLAGNGQQEMVLDTKGHLRVLGSLFSGSGTCGSGCDLVFTEDYDLPTIEEHAAEMWELGYLPNVGPTIENEPINLSDKTGRMLNELEKAHIYIEQLHKRLAETEKLLAEQAEKIDQILRLQGSN